MIAERERGMSSERPWTQDDINRLIDTRRWAESEVERLREENTRLRNRCAALEAELADINQERGEL
jgi:uncharacterized circularly permuted ATP-grasp superfamily protein